MAQKRIFFIFLGIAAAVAVLSLIADVQPYEGIGRPAPDFSLTSLDGAEVSLSGLRGTPVILNFWATWCDPCLSEMPLLEKTSQPDERSDRLAGDRPFND